MFDVNDLSNAQLEVRQVARELALHGKFEQISEIVPGMVYDLQLGPVAFRVSVAVDVLRPEYYRAFVDVAERFGGPWMRSANGTNRYHRTAAEAFEDVATRIRLERKPHGT